MYAISKEKIDNHVKISKFPKEYVYLATCHRQEIYTKEEFNIEGFKSFNGQKAVEHLLEVVSGLRSFIIGETEILGQVREAFNSAERNGHINKTLHELFQSASNFGRKVRRDTKISRYKSSVTSIIFDFINKDQQITVLGCGFLGEKILKSLSKRNFRHVFCLSRNFVKTQKVCSHFGYKAIPYNEINDILKKSDVIISALNQSVQINLPITKVFVIDFGNNILSDNNLKILKLAEIKKIGNKLKNKKKGEIKKVKKMIKEDVKKIYKRLKII